MKTFKQLMSEMINPIRQSTPSTQKAKAKAEPKIPPVNPVITDGDTFKQSPTPKPPSTYKKPSRPKA
jgi:hypothetical protein